MPYVISYEKPIAYVSKEKVVIAKNTAGLIEPCLMAYGYSVNMGIDETVRTFPPIEGFPLKGIEKEFNEDKIATIISICATLITGTKPNIVSEETKLYEIVSEGGKSEKEETDIEIEFEQA